MAIYAEIPFIPNNDMPTYLTDMTRNGTSWDRIVLVSLAHALGSLGLWAAWAILMLQKSQTITTVHQYD